MLRQLLRCVSDIGLVPLGALLLLFDDMDIEMRHGGGNWPGCLDDRRDGIGNDVDWQD